MTQFRPCIDLHAGQVKQIVGGSLEHPTSALQTNHVSSHPASYFAERYSADQLGGGHVIQLGPGNTAAARAALAAYPQGLQIGGGIQLQNAADWLIAGASHVIVTSYLFDAAGHFLADRLAALVAEVGRDKLVIDLSCRRNENGWTVAMNRWQKLTELSITPETLQSMAQSCDEFLIHAADVEGKCQGIDTELVGYLGAHCPIACTYAGGARSIEDLATVERLSQVRVDLSIGSALDLFGGTQIAYADCLKWNRRPQACHG